MQANNILWHFHPLITDWCFYICVALAFIALWIARGAQQRTTWTMIFSRPSAMIAATVLIFYLAITALDSIHFSTGNAQNIFKKNYISLLDRTLLPLTTKNEKSYSAPLATNLAVASSKINQDGKIQRAYTHLKRVPKNINASNKQHDINFIILKYSCGWSVIMGIALIIIIYSMFINYIRKNKQRENSKLIILKKQWSSFWNPGNKIQWGCAFITVFILGLITCIALGLSRHYHVLGTDQIGQDVLYKTIKSVRTGVLLGTLTTLFMLPFALLCGPLAGYCRGWVDDIIQYIYTTLSAIPGVLLIAASVLALQLFMSHHQTWFSSLEQRADSRLLILCLILGITSWTTLCRLLRAETLKLRDMEYVQAARCANIGLLNILRSHIIPNIMHIILITIVLDFSGLVLAEAVLSYVGVGVDPNTISWGQMINQSRLELARLPVIWWPLLAALLGMFGLVLSANILSDHIRDAFDPQCRQLRTSNNTDK